MNYVSGDLDGITFGSSFFGGFNKASVLETMQKVAEDYREREKEIKELQNKVELLQETVAHYKTIEESMQHCLIIAQHTSDEMIKSANEKSKDILAQADATSQKIVQDAYEQANKVKLSYEDMKNKIYTFKVKSEALLKSQLDVLNQLAVNPNES
jgi:cell division initiation protein